MTQEQLKILIDLLERSLKIIENKESKPFERVETINDLRSLIRGLKEGK